jgi:NAD(P)-dependent dehydrogenase (short-subunit alcohol dehydrogenase family)|tara:strand:+ start:299 stop:580 length:282 start_codon:yes stop_codon:yes gene_type:complete
MSSHSLQNKKIIISAGASGIGWATTKVCVAKGASVYLCDIDLTASIAALAICSGVFGKSGCFFAVSPDPVTAHEIITFSFILLFFYIVRNLIT